MTSLNVAEAKAKLCEILRRVAHGDDTILITRLGKPMVELVPPGTGEGPNLADVEGWLDDDPFFATMESIEAERSDHLPRVVSQGNPFDAPDEV